MLPEGVFFRMVFDLFQATPASCQQHKAVPAPLFNLKRAVLCPKRKLYLAAVSATDHMLS